MQTTHFDCLLFDPFSLLYNSFVATEVDVGGCDVVDALMIALVVEVIDQRLDLSLEITRQKVVFEQDAVLKGLMPAFDLALCLWVIRCAMRELHALVLHPFALIS